MGGFFKALILILLAGGGAVVLAPHLPVAHLIPTLPLWPPAHAGAAAAPPPVGTTYAQPFTLPTSCNNTVRQVAIRGVTQLDGGKLHREAPLLEEKPFSMAAGLALLRYIRNAYQREQLPLPVLSLRLDDLCHGNLTVQVTEDTPASPPVPAEVMERLLADVRTLIATEAPAPAPPATPLAYPPPPRRTADQLKTFLAGIVGGILYPPPTSPGTAPPAPLEKPLAYQPVALLLPPPAYASPSAQPPGGVWPENQPDTSNTPMGSKGLVQRGEEDLLLLAALLNGHPFLNGFQAYLDTNPQQAWVPLSVFMQALDFPIRTDPGAGRAEGWFIKESNTFQLDMAAQTLTIRGKALPYPASDIERHSDDIYIRSHLLAAWFPLTVQVNMNDLRLLLTSTEELPGEARRLRAASWEQLEQARKLAEAQTIKNAIPIPYRMLSAPVLRINGNLNSSMPADSPALTTAGLNLQAEGDALYSTGRVALAAERDANGRINLSDATLSFSREELTPSLLGPLRATTLQVGDITAAGLALSRGQGTGRGIRANNRPFHKVDDPDRFVVEGTAPIGWDVEVYQDQSLLAFQRIATDGRYRFATLPLRAGLNLFRIVQHGPRGERHESIERYYLGQDMPQAGDLQYDTTIFQPGAKTIGTDAGSAAPQPWQLLQRFDVGLTNTLAATLGGYGLVPAGTVSPTQAGLTGGLRATLGRTYLTADIMETESNARTYALTGRGNLWEGADLRLGYSANSGYASIDQPMRDRFEGEVTTAFAVGLMGVNSSFGYQRVKTLTGNLSHTFTQRTSLQHNGLNFTNTLSTQWSGRPQEPFNRSIQGEAGLAGNSYDIGWRGSIAYNPQSPNVFTRALLSGHIPLQSNLSLDTTYTYVNSSPGRSELTGNLRYDFGSYALGVQGRGDTLGNTQLGLTFSTLLLPQQSLAYKQAHPTYGAGFGRALVRVFTDDNANGVLDAGEKPLAGVTVRNRSRGTRHLTDQQGIAVVDNLPANTPVKISVDDETLPDIFLKSAKESVALISHPGANGTVDYPLRLYGEVLGSLFSITAEGVVRPVGNLMVQLTDAAGHVVDYAVSEHDGYFAMAPVPLGSYSLRLNPHESEGSGYQLAKPVTVTLNKTSNSLQDVMVELAAPAQPSPSAPPPATPQPASNQPPAMEVIQ